MSSTHNEHSMALERQIIDNAASILKLTNKPTQACSEAGMVFTTNKLTSELSKSEVSKINHALPMDFTNFPTRKAELTTIGIDGVKREYVGIAAYIASVAYVAILRKENSDFKFVAAKPVGRAPANTPMLLAA